MKVYLVLYYTPGEGHDIDGPYDTEETARCALRGKGYIEEREVKTMADIELGKLKRKYTLLETAAENVVACTDTIGLTGIAIALEQDDLSDAIRELRETMERVWP